MVFNFFSFELAFSKICLAFSSSIFRLFSSILISFFCLMKILLVEEKSTNICLNPGWVQKLLGML